MRISWLSLLAALALAVSACSEVTDTPVSSSAHASRPIAAAPAVSATDASPPSLPDTIVPSEVSAAATPPAPTDDDARPTWWPACAAPPCLDQNESSWVESREGYVNRWLSVGPLTDRKLRRMTRADALLAAFDRRPDLVALHTNSDPVMELAPYERPERKDAPGPLWLLRAKVFSPAAREVALKVGVGGQARVFINGASVWHAESDDRLLPDHHRVVSPLRAGWNDVLVRLDKLPPYALRFSMRVRAIDGRPASGLVWGLPGRHGALDGLCEALQTEIGARVTPEGWVLTGEVRARGLMPEQIASGLRLDVAGERPAAIELGYSGSLLADAPQTVALNVPASPSERVATLSFGDQACATRTLPATSEAMGRLFAVETALPALKLSEGDAASLEFAAQQARAWVEAGDQPRRAGEALDTLERLVARAKGGEAPYAKETGVVTRAYRSRMDGSLQRYVLLVPPSYVGRAPAPFPLVVASHGLWYTPEDMVRIVAGEATGPGQATKRDGSSQFDFPDFAALVVAHDGYGNSGHKPPGELDVDRVIAEVRRAYRVDNRRISVTGFSLGGSVGFWIPLHRPDAYSAAAPLCGYPNLSEYRTIRTAKKRPWEDALLGAEGIVDYADNGRYLPLRIVHGGRDNPRRSEVIVERYRDLGYTAYFEVPPAAGHNVWDDAYADGSLVRWLARQKRPDVPRSPRLRTAKYRFSKAYWLRIDRFARHGRFGELRGSLGAKRVSVNTEDVAAFTIVAADLGDRLGETLSLTVDGQRLGDVKVTGDIHLVREGKAWRPVDAVAVPPGAKRAGLEGPLRDIWYEPFIIIYGTQDPLQTEANRIVAEDARRYNTWSTLTMPVKADTEIEERDLVGRSVVLVGNPASNSVTARAVAKMPLRFQANGLTFGGRRFEGAEVGISTILPSTFDPDHYMVIHAGVGPEGTLAARYLPEFVPDYLIYDGGLKKRWGDRILKDRDVLAGGFYDAQWRLAPLAPDPGGGR